MSSASSHRQRAYQQILNSPPSATPSAHPGFGDALRSCFSLPRWYRRYPAKEYFLRDLIAGFTVAMMAVPQSMSYATVAGLPPVFGLYNAFVGLLPYFLFGTSPFLISGPTAVMSILVDASIPHHLGHNTSISTGPNACDASHTDVGCEVRTSMALTLSLVAGIILIAMGSLRLGILSDLMSTSVIDGFTSGAAFLIAATQVPGILGISKCTASEPCHHGIPIVDNIHNVFLKFGEIHYPTLIFGLLCVVVLLTIKYLPAKVLSPQMQKKFSLLTKMGPIIVLLASVTTMMAGSHDGKDWQGIKTVGSVCNEVKGRVVHPECLPSLKFPTLYAVKGSGPKVSADAALYIPDVLTLIGPAVAVSLVGYAESMSIAKTVHKSGTGQTVQSNQELFALGACNLVSSFFSGYPVTGSFSRTAVNARSGARSQFASLIAALTVGTALLFFTQFLQYTPKAALAAIVIEAIVGLVKLRKLRAYYYMNQNDFFVFLISFSATLLLGVEPALVISIVTSWALHLATFTPAEMAVLKVSGIPAIGNNHSNPDQRVAQMADYHLETSGTIPLICSSIKEDFVLIVRPRTPLVFSNAESLRKTFNRILSIDGLAVAVILECRNVHHVDVTGLNALADIIRDFRRRGVIFHVAALPQEVYDVLQVSMTVDDKIRKSFHGDPRKSVANVLLDIPKDINAVYRELSKTNRTPARPEEDLNYTPLRT